MDRTATSLPPLPRRRPGLRANFLDGEAVLYDPAHHAVHYLNRTATIIWACCDGQHDPPAIAERLSEAFDIAEYDHGTHARLCEDVSNSLRSMLDNGLIDWQEQVTA